MNGRDVNIEPAARGPVHWVRRVDVLDDAKAIVVTDDRLAATVQDPLGGTTREEMSHRSVGAGDAMRSRSFRSRHGPRDELRRPDHPLGDGVS